MRHFHSSRKTLLPGEWKQAEDSNTWFFIYWFICFSPNNFSNTKDTTASTPAAITAQSGLSSNRKRWKTLGASEFSTSTTEETRALLLSPPPLLLSLYLTCGRLYCRGMEAVSIIKKKIKELGSQSSAEADDTINQVVNYGPEVEAPQE